MLGLDLDPLTRQVEDDAAVDDESGHAVARYRTSIGGRGLGMRRADSLLGMRRILVTGMSGTGKSTALAEFAKRGFQVVETDVGPWSEWSKPAGGYVWREDRKRLRQSG